MGKTKFWLLVAGICILVGCTLFGVVMTELKWDFSQLSTAKFVDNTHTPTQDFTRIVVDTDTASILFAPSDDGCTVACHEEEKARHNVFVQDGTLHIQVVNEKKWYDHIGIHFASPKLTVQLPRKQYDALTVKCATGSVTVSGQLALGEVEVSVATGAIDLSRVTMQTGILQTNTGRTTLSDVSCDGVLRLVGGTGRTVTKDLRCGELLVTTGTGDVELINTVADERFTISAGTGDVLFACCDAPDIQVSTGTGDVEGSLLSGKCFDADTKTGDVRLPANSGTQTCHIQTGTGDIRITVE